MKMKHKTIRYDEIITACDDDDEFNHGYACYENYVTGNGIKLLSSRLDLHLAILPRDREMFIEELTKLFDKYAK